MALMSYIIIYSVEDSLFQDIQFLLRHEARNTTYFFKICPYPQSDLEGEGRKVKDGLIRYLKRVCYIFGINVYFVV